MKDYSNHVGSSSKFTQSIIYSHLKSDTATPYGNTGEVIHLKFLANHSSAEYFKKKINRTEKGKKL